MMMMIVMLSLVAEWDRESSLEVEMGDSGGGVGESGSSAGSAGVFFWLLWGRNNLGWSLLFLRACF